jgi:DNA-binding NarL/FixJ family response regulator
MMVKVFIIDEHPVTMRGLASILEMCAGCQVVGDANTVQSALQEIGEIKPDIVIMDASGGGGNYIKDIAMIKEKYDKVKIFILTDSTKGNDFINAISAGVKGYFSKGSEVSQLIDAISLVATGGAVVYSSQITGLFDSTLRGTNQMDQLSQREKEILSFVARGRSNRDIANLCFVSEATVKSHMRRIMEKLDVKNRAEAVTSGFEKGLLEITPREAGN